MREKQEEFSEWVVEGKRRNAIHLLIIYDGSLGKYFPVYVMPGENLEQKKRLHDSGSYSFFTDIKL